jgi:hypothetical protein
VGYNIALRKDKARAGQVVGSSAGITSRLWESDDIAEAGGLESNTLREKIGLFLAFGMIATTTPVPSAQSQSEMQTTIY